MTFFPYLLATALAVGLICGIVSGVRAGLASSNARQAGNPQAYQRRKSEPKPGTDYDVVVDIESCNEL